MTSSSANFRYSYFVGDDWSEKWAFPAEASIKKLLRDEISRKPSTRQNVPSIVARLMGVDVLPPEARSAVHPIKKVKKCSSNWKPSKQQFDEANYAYDSQNLEKPKRREHPQEEELQKFKKEFEAWQAARFRECSRFCQAEDINFSVHPNKKREVTVEQQTIRYSAEKHHSFQNREKQMLINRNAKGRVSGAVPTTIVVLKPGPWSSDDSWTSFSGSSEERGGMEDFLEEVKEKLKREMQGKALPFRETSSETQQRTKPKKVRESSMGLIQSESVHVDTRKLLAERLRHVLGNERHLQARSFRQHEELSPKNLVRSLSAPVSGSSSGKHESVKNLLVDARKERFNFRERVKSTFTLKGRLFRRTMQQPVASPQSFMNDIMSGPTVTSNRNEIYENSTEVPPSPASVCSSVQEDFWKPTNEFSPVSSADTSPADIDDDAEMLPGFAEVNGGSSELDQPDELEDEALSFVRALLLGSGIYGRSSHLHSSSCDSFEKMISNSVYEQVEEFYKVGAKEAQIDHKILHDLLNDALLLVLQPHVIFPKMVSGCNLLPHTDGEKLLNSVWRMIRASIELPHRSVDDVVACDMESSLWCRSLDAEFIVCEIEDMILADLAHEIMKRKRGRSI